MCPRLLAPEKRSLYMGIATAAGSFGQFALLPVTQFLIASMDWHNALLVLDARITQDFSTARTLPALAGVMLLLYGMIWESDA